jgi:hypothetical protein
MGRRYCNPNDMRVAIELASSPTIILLRLHAGRFENHNAVNGRNTGSPRKNGLRPTILIVRAQIDPSATREFSSSRIRISGFANNSVPRLNLFMDADDGFHDDTASQGLSGMRFRMTNPFQNRARREKRIRNSSEPGRSHGLSSRGWSSPSDYCGSQA